VQGEGSRVFQSGARLSQDLIDAIPSHQAVVMRAQDNSVLATASLSSADYGSGDKFIYSGNVNLGLEEGETYIIALWDYKNADEGQSMSEDLEARQFGLIEDYSRMKTGSAIEILGPTTADDSSGSPVNINTIYLEPGTPPKGLSQGYGPLNIAYVHSSSPPPMYSSVSVTSNQNNYNGYRGVLVTIGSDPIMVTHVGRYWTSGNSQVHHVIIIRRDEGVVDGAGYPSEIVASALVHASASAVDGGYNYANLERPVVLESKTDYVIAVSETKQAEGGESYLQAASSFTPASGGLWDGVTIQSAGKAWVLDRDGADAGKLKEDSPNSFSPIVNVKIH
jgi:hypothetical protein